MIILGNFVTISSKTSKSYSSSSPITLFPVALSTAIRTREVLQMQEMERIEDVPKARKRCTNKLLEPRYRVMGQELLPFGLI